MFELRPYQQEAVDSIYRHLRERNDNPCVVIPTGGGKTPVMATICKDAVDRWNGRVLILAHVKELLEQAMDKIHEVAPDMFMKTGVYSAGLKRRDTEHPIIIAGIQSIYKRACELDAFDLVIIDEAHMIPPDGDGMYRTFLKDARKVNPNLRVIGLTATPFRTSSGMICGPDNILNHICYEVGVRELIVQGWLSPLVTKASREDIDTSSLHVRAGEFISEEVEKLMDTDNVVEAACREIIEKTRDRKAVLIFAASVRHGEHIAATMRSRYGVEVGNVFGDTLDFIRDRMIADFKAGRLKYLVNVNVLTMGFDAPNIDCVAMVRPTLSPGLYYQMVGRGFRLHEGKKDCLVLDFGGNVLRHGPVDAINVTASASTNNDGEAPAKVCPMCRSVISAGYSTCPDCGHEFPPPEEKKHDATATSADILSGQVSISDFEVKDVSYTVHRKRGAPDTAPRTMRVDYRVGFNIFHSEWICFEHEGFAREKAEDWWSRRSTLPCPTSAQDAVAYANNGCLKEPQVITVRKVSGEDFPKIVRYEFESTSTTLYPVKERFAIEECDDVPF